MKRIIALILVLAFVLVGCSQKLEIPEETAPESKATFTEENKTEAKTEEETEDIGAPEPWDADGEFSIIAIGNSFSADSLTLLPNVLRSLGIEKFMVAYLYIGGCTIETHYENAKLNMPAYEYWTYKSSKKTWESINAYKMKNALASRRWDYVSFQQGSTKSGVPESFGHLPELCQMVREVCPYSHFVWNMTWAYQGDSKKEQFATYNNDQTQMYNAIINCVNQFVASDPQFEIIIPTGTAVQNARSSYVGDTLTKDGYHLSRPLGRYIASLTQALALTGMPIDSVSYKPEEADEQFKLMAIESADNAMNNKFAVTRSQYR